MTQHVLLFEAFTGTPTAIMKNKLGIKNDAISDENFTKLVDTGIERSLIPGFVRFMNADNTDNVIYYAQQVKQHGLKLNLANYTNFVEFSEAVDAAISAKEIKREVEQFSPLTTPADHEAANGRYKVYVASSKNDCVKYGKGQTFCISRLGTGNMYYTYRTSQSSKFYFVYDMRMKNKNSYVTVIDVNSRGFEFTQVDNNTPATTKKFSGSLEKFLKTKPGLEELAKIFISSPLTSHETDEIQKWKDVNHYKTFSKLNYKEKLGFIQYGMFGLPANDFDALDKDLKHEYINYGLPVKTESISKLTASQTKLFLQRALDADNHLSKERFNLLIPQCRVMALDMGVTYGLGWNDVKPNEYDALWSGTLNSGSYDSRTLMHIDLEVVAHFSPETNMKWLKVLQDNSAAVSIQQFFAMDIAARDYALAHRVIFAADDMYFIHSTDNQKQFLLDNNLVDKFNPANLKLLDDKWADQIMDKQLVFMSSFAFAELPDKMKEISIKDGHTTTINLNTFKRLDAKWQEKMFSMNKINRVSINDAPNIPVEWVERFKDAELVKSISCTDMGFMMMRDEQRKFLVDNNLVKKARENSMEFGRLRDATKEVLYDLDLVE